jgi:hypothetical protein
MYELDFFGLINGVGIEFLAWFIATLSISTVIMGLIWPMMEGLFQKWEAEELMEVLREIDAEVLEEMGTEIVQLEAAEAKLMWHIDPGLPGVWTDMAWKSLVPIVRRRETLEQQLDHIWSTPILLT